MCSTIFLLYERRHFMKYCCKCGHELIDEAVVCPHCGCAVPGANWYAARPSARSDDSPNNLQVIAKVLMIISCVFSAFCIIPLCWELPMTLTYCNHLKERKPVGIEFKVCTLIFVSVIAGILMLCDDSDNK